MTNQDDSRLQRVSSQLPSLARNAANLNTASNALSKLIERINLALQRLNLGVPAWVTVARGDNAVRGGIHFWSEDLGYSRIGRKWGLTLRRIEGYEGLPESFEEEEWAFTDAPRPLRIMAVPKIPELIQKLDQEAIAMASQVFDSVDQTKPLVEAIELSAPSQRSIKKKDGGRS